MKMNLATTAKAGGAGILAMVAWITSTFGEAFYVLAALLILDMMLNYANETQFIQKTGNILIGTAAAFYIQNISMSGIEIAHGLVIVLALNELTQVGTTLKARLDAYKSSHPSDTPAVDADQLLVDQITEKVLEGLSPKAVGPATNIPPLQPPLTGAAVGTKEGVNGE